MNRLKKEFSELSISFFNVNSGDDNVDLFFSDDRILYSNLLEKLIISDE